MEMIKSNTDVEQAGGSLLWVSGVVLIFIAVSCTSVVAVEENLYGWSEPDAVLLNTSTWDGNPSLLQDGNGTYWIAWQRQIPGQNMNLSL